MGQHLKSLFRQIVKIRTTARTAGLLLSLSVCWTGGAFAQVRPAIIIDNEDPGFTQLKGTWNVSTRDEGYYGHGYLWGARDGDDRASGPALVRWRAELPQAGRYNVYARWVWSKPDDRAANAHYSIRSDLGVTDMRVNIQAVQSAAMVKNRPNSPWNLLGTFEFDASGVVELANDGDNSVVADAVMFEYMEPAGTEPPPRGALLFSDDFANLSHWSTEGAGSVTVADGAMHVTSDSYKKGVHAWFNTDLPDNVRIEYDLTYHRDDGFTLFFFCAHGPNGEDILKDLPPRDGTFNQYVNNEHLLNYHGSFHRYGGAPSVIRHAEGVNLNRNPPKTLVQRNARDLVMNPVAGRSFHITLIKTGPRIQLLIDSQEALLYIDDAGDDWFTGGKFGFRQIYTSDVSYDNFRVWQVE